MRLTFVFGADVADDRTGDPIDRVPESLNGWLASDYPLDYDLDPDEADQGVVGGEISAAVANGRISLRVVYWLPASPSEELIERLRLYSVAQLNDGIGENGFPFTSAGIALRVRPSPDDLISTEVADDGRVVPRASQIAIAARDGDLEGLRRAIEVDREGIERQHQGCTPLHLSILYGHIEAARLLLGAGADPNRLDRTGAAPLELCALSNSLEDEQSAQLARALLASGADAARVDSHGYTARGYAEIREKREMAAIL